MFSKSQGENHSQQWDGSGEGESEQEPNTDTSNEPQLRLRSIDPPVECRQITTNKRQQRELKKLAHVANSIESEDYHEHEQEDFEEYAWAIGTTDVVPPSSVYVPNFYADALSLAQVKEWYAVVQKESESDADPSSEKTMALKQSLLKLCPILVERSTSAKPMYASLKI